MSFFQPNKIELNSTHAESCNYIYIFLTSTYFLPSIVSILSSFTKFPVNYLYVHVHDSNILTNILTLV